jgi:hypothetical protein
VSGERLRRRENLSHFEATEEMAYWKVAIAGCVEEFESGSVN